MGKKLNIHTREFKVEAVQLVENTGKPMSQLARTEDERQCAVSVVQEIG